MSGKIRSKAKERPAESVTLAAAVAALAASLGVEFSDGTYRLIVAVLAVIPAAVTHYKATRG